MSAVMDVIYGFFLVVDAIGLKLISWAYGIFVEISSMRINNLDAYNEIIDRIYIVVGIVALFMVAYTLLQNIIDPDSKETDNGFSIVKKILISVVAVVLIPTAFDFLYGLQNAVLNGNVIEHLFSYEETLFEEILEVSDGYVKYDGYYLSSNCIFENLDECVIQNSPNGALTESNLINDQNIDFDILERQQTGNQMAYYLLSSFLYPLVENDEDTKVAEPFWLWNQTSGAVLSTDRYTWDNVSKYVIVTGKFDIIVNFGDHVSDDIMNYDFIISTAAIIVFGICLCNFVLDVGLRVIKLAFYQLIAPIPIFMSILPKSKDLLKNWIKIVMTTYVEVFIRVTCLSAGVFFIRMIIDYIDFLMFG